MEYLSNIQDHESMNSNDYLTQRNNGQTESPKSRWGKEVKDSVEYLRQKVQNRHHCHTYLAPFSSQLLTLDSGPGVLTNSVFALFFHVRGVEGLSKQNGG